MLRRLKDFIAFAVLLWAIGAGLWIAWSLQQGIPPNIVRTVIFGA